MTEAAWTPQPGFQAQACALRSIVDELFAGGSRGPGKTDYLIGDFLQDVSQGAAWQGVLFRKSFPELDEVLKRTHQVYPMTGAHYKVGTHTWEWPNGATLKLRHIETVFDVTNYQGHAYSWIGYDELPNWPDMAIYNQMKACLRGPARNKRIRATGNPGGPGHLAVQDYFLIDRHPLGGVPYTDPATGMVRMFVRGTLKDNKILHAFDPGYEQRLDGVGDPELVRAWKEGDWNALVGGYFSSTWHNDEIMETSFDIPDGWPLFGGVDYGEASPTAFLMGAMDFDGTIHICGEYYQKERTASEHAKSIRETIEDNPHTGGRRPSNIHADPSMWTKRRLEESHSKSPYDIFSEEKVYLRKGNNNRVNGWRIVRDCLLKRKFKVFHGWAPNLVRSLPVLPRDPKNPEDVDTDAEDHAPDALRYALVSVYKPKRHVGAPKNSEGKRILDQIDAMGLPKRRYA